jgi:hypothetical protein
MGAITVFDSGKVLQGAKNCKVQESLSRVQSYSFFIKNCISKRRFLSIFALIFTKFERYVFD